MVKPANEQHSVEDIVQKAKEMHLSLVDWADMDAERTYVIASIQQAENTYQAFRFANKGGPPQ